MAKNLTYTEWMRKVNQELIKLCDLDADCLPDYMYYDSWKAGDTPAECAEAALDYARGY